MLSTFLHLAVYVERYGPCGVGGNSLDRPGSKQQQEEGCLK